MVVSQTIRKINFIRAGVKIYCKIDDDYVKACNYTSKGSLSPADSSIEAWFIRLQSVQLHV